MKKLSELTYKELLDKIGKYEADKDLIQRMIYDVQ